MIIMNPRMYEASKCHLIATTTLAAIAAVTAIVGTVASVAISAVGMSQQADAQKKVGEYNEKIQQNNAIAQRQQAQFEAKRIRDNHIRLHGAQEAAISKSGIQISGSANDVMYDSAIESELDALTSIYKGNVGANADNAAAALSRFEGDSNSSNTTNAMYGSILTGVTSTVGTAAKGYGNYLGAKAGKPSFS